MKRRRISYGENKCETVKQQRHGPRCPDPEESSSHHVAAKFTHESLKDVQNEIRLLQMLPNGNDNEESLEFSIRTEDFHNANDFIAISYTWGSETDQRSINIDSKQHPVRHNCQYVLKQTYRQWKQGMLQSDLIWIDSVCINQDDNAEKSLQVSIMGEIYSKAGLVLACVGSHADDSELVIQKAWEVADFKYDCTHGDFLCNDCVSPWQEWATSLGIECLSRLCWACERFGERTYWTRVWIIQEIAMATSLRIICGDDVLPWTAIHNLEDFLSMVLDEIDSIFDTYGQLPTVENNPMHEVFLAKKEKVPIDEVFSQFSKFDCKLPRDHLYGLLALIEWPQYAGPIVPDYDISTFDVAIQMVPYIAFQRIPQMLAAFRITSEDKDVKRLLDRRREECVSSDVDSDVRIVRESKILHASTQMNQSARALCGCIEVTEDGNITVALVRKVLKGYKMPPSSSEAVDLSDDLSEDTSGSEDSPGLESDMGSFLSSISSERQPRRIFHGAELAGLVCHDARKGDVLVPLTDREGEVHLVLRQNYKEVYDIVGQGVLLPGYQLGCDSGAYDDSTEVPLFQAQIELKTTAEDVILLFAQDRADLDMDGLSMNDAASDVSDFSCSREDRWKRVLTDVSRFPSEAARLTMRTQMLAKDVVIKDEPFEPQAACAMSGKVHDACSSVVGQYSTWVVGRVAEA